MGWEGGGGRERKPLTEYFAITMLTILCEQIITQEQTFIILGQPTAPWKWLIGLIKIHNHNRDYQEKMNSV